MFDIKILLRLTRIEEYLPRLILIFPLIFLIFPQNFFSYKTVIIFLANFFFTTFVYAFNDVEDAEDDYHVLKKRKRNPISNGDLTKTQGYLICLLLLLVTLFFLLIISPLVFLVGSIFSLIGFFYSWKPVRLKSIPIIDLISHALCLGVGQFFIVYLSFRPLDLFITPFLMIIAPMSFLEEMRGQLEDFNIDKKTKINNTIQKFGKIGIKNLIVASILSVIIGFVLIFLSISLENNIINLSVSVFITIIAINRLNTIFKRCTSLQY